MILPRKSPLALIFLAAFVLFAAVSGPAALAQECSIKPTFTPDKVTLPPEGGTAEFTVTYPGCPAPTGGYNRADPGSYKCWGCQLVSREALSYEVVKWKFSFGASPGGGGTGVTVGDVNFNPTPDNTAVLPVFFELEHVPPHLEITSPAEGARLKATDLTNGIPLSFTVSDAAPSSCIYYYSYALLNSEGKYLRYDNNSGYTWHDTAPVLWQPWPLPTAYCGQSPSPPIQTGISPIPGGEPSGTYTILLRVKDNAGNEAEARRSFTLDLIPPSVVINSPTSLSVMGRLTLIDGRVGDDRGGYGVETVGVAISRGEFNRTYWNGTAWVPPTAEIPFIPPLLPVSGTTGYVKSTGPLPSGDDLPDGTYDAYIYARDKSGNFEMRGSQFTISSDLCSEAAAGAQLVGFFDFSSMPPSRVGVPSSKIYSPKVVDNCTGLPVPDATLSLDYDVSAYSGHHNHDDGARPAFLAAKLPPTTLTSPTGFFDIRYTAPEVSGTVQINISCTVPSGKPCVGGTIKVRVQVDALTELTAGTHYDLKAPTTEHPLAYYGILPFNETMKALADDYFAAFGQKLFFNDMSLPLGGRFDLGLHWGGSHHNHSDGEALDLRIKFVPRERRAKLLQMAMKRGLGVLREFEYQDGDVANTHWHLMYNKPNYCAFLLEKKVKVPWCYLATPWDPFTGAAAAVKPEASKEAEAAATAATLVVQATAENSLDPATNLYLYKYAFQNDASSTQEVSSIVLPLNGARVQSTLVPSGWTATVSPDQATVTFAATAAVADPPGYVDDGDVPASPNQIKPGQTLSGFSFKSADQPGDVDFVAQGASPLPVLGDDGSATGSAEVFLGKTVGPVANSSLQFEFANYPVNERRIVVELFVVREGNLSQPATVKWSAVDGTAHLGLDYIVYNGGDTLEFGPFERSKRLPVSLVFDGNDKGDDQPQETFSVVLNSPTGAKLGERNAATVTILDDDPLAYAISGAVKVGTAPLGGVSLLLASTNGAPGFAARTVTTNSAGAFSFAGVPAGYNYTVTAKSGTYTFSPASISVTNLGADRTGLSFSATRAYTISGAVLNGTSGVGGVTLKLTSTTAGFTPRTVTSGASGAYSFTTVPSGRSYVITPSSAIYNFTQSSRSVPSLSANVTGQNFSVASRKSYPISGQLKLSTAGLNGVAVNLKNAGTGAVVGTVTTATSPAGVVGSYTFANVPAGYNYTVAPAVSATYTYTPVSRAFTALASAQTGQNFAAALKTYTISGAVKLGTAGVGGITLTLTSTTAGFAPRNVVSAATSGAYSFANVPAGRSYAVTPAASSLYSFTPASKSYANLSASQTAQTFTATRKLYAISGKVVKACTTTGVGGVTMTLKNGAGVVIKTVTTLADGAYSMTGVPAGVNYVLRPAKTGMTFTPASKSYTNLSANQAAQNFSGT